MAAVATVLLVPLNSPGCAGPLMVLVSGDRQVEPFVEPLQSNAEVESDNKAIASAQALVAEQSKAVTAAEAQDANARALRERADKAETAAQAAELNLSVSGGASTAQLDVDMAQSSVETAQSNIKFWEEAVASDRQYGIDTTFGAEQLKAAKADLATANAELEKAKVALKTAKSKDTTAKAATNSARATANSLSAKADAAEKSASAALSATRQGLAEAESQLSSAQQTKLSNAGGHADVVASAFRAHRSAVRSVEGSNAVRADCRSNARPDLAAAGLLALTAVAVAFAPLRGRQRAKSVAERSTEQARR